MIIGATATLTEVLSLHLKYPLIIIHIKKGDLEKAQKNHQMISRLMDIYMYGPTFFTAMTVYQRWFDVSAGHGAPCDVFPADLRYKVVLEKY